MANYHLKVKGISRSGGHSCVSSLAYRTGTKLVDQRTGETWDYSAKKNVGYVEICTSKNSPLWIQKIVDDCKINKQSSLQKLSDIFEASEKRKDARVYREIEFSLPNELTNEQNIAWATRFIQDTCVKLGMVAINSFHFEVDEKTGEGRPHCHTLLSTRELTETGFSSHKQREWDRVELLEHWREQYAQYQNMALKEHGYETRVDHRSYADRGLREVIPQPKLGKAVSQMTKSGISTDKQTAFDVVRLKNQFTILKNPELVFSIVTANHSTFTSIDVAKVLNRYIDDPQHFNTLYHRLMNSNELVLLKAEEKEKECEAVYTTRDMLKTEIGLVRTAETLAAQKTHDVDEAIVGEVISRQNQALGEYGGLSADQDRAIRHMLSADQISCVVGFAGAGKTTSLESAKEAWEQAGYKVLGLAPTGKAAENMAQCGIRSMTLHKFLYAQKGGREQVSKKSVLVLDEAGMVDSRRFAQLLTLVEKTGTKLVPMGDGNQLQAVEAGPAFRLLTNRIEPAVLETIVRQREEWQREATRLFGTLESKKALELHQERGTFKTVEENTSGLDPFERFCLARQISGRIWKEMEEDTKNFGGSEGKIKSHQDHPVYRHWKTLRQDAVKEIISDFEGYKPTLESKGIDGVVLEHYVSAYKEAGPSGADLFKKIESLLRDISYENLVDTRVEAKKALVEAWARDRQNSPDQSHLMLAFTNKDATILNKVARSLMRDQGMITGPEFVVKTCFIEKDDFGKESKIFEDKAFAQGDRLLFTRNDTGLGVKNGTLGTVTSIDKNKMAVVLDGADKKQVSFAPKLYPFIDHGWATTIHKAQGVTVDHVKMLASYEQYRNLSYVGISRHRYSIEVFASNLDFWREGKIVDRLSRIQEKLSGVDYLDPEKIYDQLKTDEQVLWHEKKLQQGRDLWTAVKITTTDAVGHLFGASEKRTVRQEFPSFDNSEEKRSQEMFKVREKVGVEGSKTQDIKAEPSPSLLLQRTTNSEKNFAPFQDIPQKIQDVQEKYNLAIPSTLPQDTYQRRVTETFSSMLEWAKEANTPLNTQEKQQLLERSCYTHTRLPTILQTYLYTKPPLEAYEIAQRVALIEATLWTKEKHLPYFSPSFIGNKGFMALKNHQQVLEPKLVQELATQHPHLIPSINQIIDKVY